MTIAEIIDERGITQVLHFTTTKGLLGILACGSVKSRQRLPEDKYLECVYEPNCHIRFDGYWLDYVNLSIEAINKKFFSICSTRWHADSQWCILSFDPNIITHENVYFATTNNRYTGVARKAGADGLLALYALRIRQWEGQSVTRLHGQSPAEPTCTQAEVLYPGELSIEHLQKIIFSEHEQQDNLAGQLAVLGYGRLHHEVNEDYFH
jgi:hypothetical protein